MLRVQILQQRAQTLYEHIHVVGRADERRQEAQGVRAGGVQHKPRLKPCGHHVGSSRRLVGEVDAVHEAETAHLLHVAS